jgi:hypothetical protein
MLSDKGKKLKHKLVDLNMTMWNFYVKYLLGSGITFTVLNNSLYGDHKKNYPEIDEAIDKFLSGK